MIRVDAANCQCEVKIKNICVLKNAKGSIGPDKTIDRSCTNFQEDNTSLTS